MYVIRTVSRSEGEGRRGEGEAVEWELEVERSTKRRKAEEDERLNHRDRELECVRGFVLNVCFSGE